MRFFRAREIGSDSSGASFSWPNHESCVDEALPEDCGPSPEIERSPDEGALGAVGVRGSMSAKA
jgi:hypothetical protein